MDPPCKVGVIHITFFKVGYYDKAPPGVVMAHLDFSCNAS